MNPIAKAMDEIKFNIPPEILNIFFGYNQNTNYSSPISIEERITSTVIRPRVMVDANLVGGQSMDIYIGDLTPTIYDVYTTLYRIPSERTGHKKILTVLTVNFMPFMGSMGPISSLTGATASSNNDLSIAGMRIGMSYSSIPSISTATAELVGDNAVLIRDSSRLTANYVLRCLVENDKNMTNIPFKSIRAFATMCILAVKSAIYNMALIKLDKGYLEFGQDLGSVKSYIDTLSDSEEKYQTYLKEVWGKVAFMSNKKDYARFIRMQVSSGI